VFWSFRVMVGVGVLMLALSWAGAWYLLRRREIPLRLLQGFAAMAFSGWVAVLAGWLTTEIGRQPYVVYGVITTAETASDVPAPYIALTFVSYLVVYTLLLISYMVVLTQMALKEAEGKSRDRHDPGALRPEGAGT
jgi:cytochrome bd ubiquinol oxidase subunit I